MMRRRLLLGIGALTGGSTLVSGSGAFSSVAADRSVSITVSNDADALLRLAPCEGSPNGDYVTNADSGAMTLDVSPSNGNVLGEGVNPNATTVFDDVFEISNQGTQPVGVWIDVSSIENGNDEDAISFYRGSDQSDSFDGIDDAVCLGVGERVCVGFVTRTHGLEPGTNLVEPVSGDDEMVVHADAETACASTVGGGTVSVPGPGNGLVGYWPLDSVDDGVAEDVVGGNNGTHSGVTSATGIVAGAGSFDGIDDYVMVPDDPTLDLVEALTLAAWVKGPGGQDDYARFISREQSGVGNRQYNLGLDQNAQDPRVVVDTVDSDSIAVSGTLPADLVTDDSWHHVTMTFDANDALRLYLDGDEIASQAVSSSLVSRTSPVVFGAPAHLPGKDLWKGLLDDVRIYDHALPADAVGDLYDATN